MRIADLVTSPSVLPRLRHLAADITPKPHHGEDLEPLALPRDRITVESDPKLRRRLGPDRPASGATGPAGRRPAAELRLAYRRLRRVLQRSKTMRWLVHNLRWRVHSWVGTGPAATAGPLPPPSPAERREGMLRALLPHLEAERVLLARASDVPGAEAAVRSTDRRALRRALRRLADERPDLVVRLGVEWRAVATIPIGALGYHHVAWADWLSVGGVREHGTYRIGVGGHLRIQFVAHDPDRNRHLALNQRAQPVDWTPMFAPVQAGGARGPLVRVGTGRRHAAAPVDAVYTWVDPADPGWREEHRRHRDQLRYSLRSLWTFGRFVRNIYIVTADQRPPWLDPRNPRVTLVSHRDIFPDPTVLPTFNPHAIQACLHRIPGLSEHFLYLNDGVFLGREVSEADFYTAAGLAKVRFSPSRFICRGEPERHATPTDWAAYNSVTLVARDFGLSFDRRMQHVPLPLRRSVLAEIEARYPAEIAGTRAARFQAVTDLAVPSMHAQFYGIATARAVEWPTRRDEYIYLDTGRYDSLSGFREILTRRPTFFCLDTTRDREVDRGVRARHLREFLAPAFPTPAPWELPGGRSLRGSRDTFRDDPANQARAQSCS